MTDSHADSQDFQITIRSVGEIGPLASTFSQPHSAENAVYLAALSRNVVLHSDLADEQLIVCEQPAGPVCFAHIGTGLRGGQPCGYLRYLYDGGAHRSLVHATLERAEDIFRQLDIWQACAGSPDYSNIPSTEDGSISLLLMLQYGYRIVYGNVSYSMEDLGSFPRTIVDDASLTVESTPETGNGQLLNCNVRLRRSGHVIGEACCYSAWHYEPFMMSQQTCHIGDLDIVDGEQGKGLGRYLLGEAVFEMRKLGYANVTLSTGVGNVRARHLYTSAGFQQGTTEHILMKDLRADNDLGLSGVPIYRYP